MSRTTRKRALCFESYYKHWISGGLFDEGEEIKRRVEYNTSSCKWFSWKLPKSFRNRVNRTRRAYDKREIYNALNYEYEPQFSKWNCKDANTWGYW